MKWTAAFAFLLGFGFASAPAAADATGDVRVGRRVVLTLHAGQGDLSPGERAALATNRIQEAMADPECGPEGWEVIDRDSLFIVEVCSRNVLVVTPADTSWEGRGVEQIALRWTQLLREAFEQEKRAAFSSILLRRAILGILLPLGLLAAIVLIRLVARRLRGRLLSLQRKGLRIGTARLFSGSAERKVMAQIVLVLQWAAYLLLTYLFIVLLLDQFPRTASYARQMFHPFRDLVGDVGQWILLIIPRLILAALIVIVARLLLRAIARTFEQVKAGKLRVEPFLSPDTAGPAALTVRTLIAGLALLLIVLLVPGQAGKVLLVALGLAAFSFALGAREAMANVFGGLVTVYARPIHRGQRIRTSGFEGIVKQKGLLHVRLQLDDGRVVLLPNGWFLRHPVEVVGQERRLVLRLTLEPQAGLEGAEGLIRHAATVAKLKREDGEVNLCGVRDGLTIFDVEWPVTGGEAKAVRAAFLEALLEHAEGLHVRVVSARRLRSHRR